MHNDASVMSLWYKAVFKVITCSYSNDHVVKMVKRFYNNSFYPFIIPLALCRSIDQVECVCGGGGGGGCCKYTHYRHVYISTKYGTYHMTNLRYNYSIITDLSIAIWIGLTLPCLPVEAPELIVHWLTSLSS